MPHARPGTILVYACVFASFASGCTGQFTGQFGSGRQSANADLTSIELSSGTLAPTFSSSVTSYTATVPNTVNAITLTPTSADAGTSLSAQGNVVASGAPSPSIVLVVGGNAIATVVTAADGTTQKTYTVVVTRQSVEQVASHDPITPQHTIATVGNKVDLTCSDNLTNGDPAYSFDWQLLYKPTNSTATLSGSTTSTASLTPDLEGYYIISLTLSKDGFAVETYYAYVGTLSVCHYVRAGATGNNDGSDWTNAWTKLPATLTRGHTYYLADGIYGPYYCNTANNDVIPIWIKKAISTDHGTDTGWSTSTMGSSQAIFLVSDDPFPTGPLTSSWMNLSSYITIDGQVGEILPDETIVTLPGIKFISTCVTGTVVYRHPFYIGSITGGAPSISRVELKHCEITNERFTHPSTFGIGVHPDVTDLNYTRIYACYIHDIPGAMVDLINTKHALIEYNMFARDHADAEHHAEAVWISTSSDPCYTIVRHNVFIDIEGGPVCVMWGHSEMYGNLIYWTPEHVNTDPMGRHIAGIACDPAQVGQGVYAARGDYHKFYNNTIVGNNMSVDDSIAGNLGYTMYDNGTNNYIYNNIWAHCQHVFFIKYSGGEVADEDYNVIYDVEMLVYQTGAHDQFPTSNPFVDPDNYDYHLHADTDNGYNLGTPYNIDMDDVQRGSSGIWSRGACQYEE